MEDNKNKLCQFANFVLNKMENCIEWNDEVLEEISKAAQELGLANLDKGGYFKSVSLENI